MANVRSARDKSSDWSRSATGDPGDQAATKAGTAEAAAPDKPSASSRFDSKARRPSPAGNFTASALRGLGQYYDLQAATARALLRTQIRAASVFGLPDYSRVFDIADERALHLCSSATENLVSLVNHSDGSLTEIPSQLCRVFERQAIDLTERWKDGLEEWQQQATESLWELKELARQQAEELARSAESIGDAAQSTMREGGEQFRSAVGQSREMAGEVGEAVEEGHQQVRQEGRKAADEGAEPGTARSRHHGRAA